MLVPLRRARPDVRHRRRASVIVLVSLVALVFGAGRSGQTVAFATTADDAPTFRIDASHTGNQAVDVLRPPLIRKWSIDLAGPVYFPLIVGQTVFVVAGNMPGPVYPNYGSRLFALSLDDGHIIWGPKQVDPWGGGYFSGLTYDAGRLFVLTGSGYVEAIDPSTGDDVWPQAVGVGGIGVNAQPTAVGGTLYVTVVGNQYAPPTFNASDANVTALSESDGRVLWQAGIDSGDFSAPVVTNTGVYVTNACEDTWDFDPATGTQLWHYQTGCFGGGGTTPALGHGRLFIRDTANAPGTMLNPATGAVIGNFPSRLLPAFNGSTAYMIDQDTNYPGVIAWDIDTSTRLWNLPPPSGDWFNNAPVVANGFVYSTTHNGLLIAADAASGTQRWSDNLGVAIEGTNNMALAAETSGLSIGNGTLLLPVNMTLVAYANSALSGRSMAPQASSSAGFRIRGPAVGPSAAAGTRGSSRGAVRDDASSRSAARLANPLSNSRPPSPGGSAVASSQAIAPSVDISRLLFHIMMTLLSLTFPSRN